MAVKTEIEVEREFNLYLRPVTVYEDGTPQEAFFDSSLLMEKQEGSYGS